MISTLGKNLIRWQTGIVHPSMIPLNRLLVLWSVFLPLLGLPLPAQATEPALARLSFWVSPESMAEFEAAYQEQLVPLLKQHGLVESPERGRATVDSVFSRLFEVAIPFASKNLDAVLGDSVFGATLEELGTRFGNPPTRIRHELALYSVPSGAGRSTIVGPGHAVLAGRGKRHRISYDETDGMAGGIVYAITQDREGNMWFGTYQGGVSRFDGTRFETFNAKSGLPDDTVIAILQDRDGDIWFGTPKGLSRYDGVSFVTYTQQDGLPTNPIGVISQDQEGNLWIGTDKGLSRYDGQHFKTFTIQDGLAGNTVSSILQDRQGDLWVGTDGGLCRYDGQQFTRFTVREGLLSNYVSSILQDHQGNLWIGTDKGLSRYEGRAFTNYTTGPMGGGVSSIAQDSTGVLWVITAKGLGCFVGDHFDSLSVADGLSSEWPRRLFVDRESNLWVGTFGNVHCLPYEAGETFTSENGLPENAVWSIAQDRKGEMWFGTYSGVCRYDGRQITTYTQEDGLPGNSIFRMLKDRKGNLWFGVMGSGICRYDGRSFTSFTPEDSLASPAIWSLGEDRDGNIWVGTDKGVSRWDGKRFTTFTTADGLANGSVMAILQDRRGDLWFSTGLGGLSRWDGEHFTSFAAVDGLPGEDVRALCEDDKGSLWVGTAGDFVARWDGERFTTFTNADGMTGSWGWAIAQDRGGVLWIGSWSGGVSLWDGRLFQSLTQEDGLGSNQVRSLYEDLAGNMWVGTTGGVSRIRKTALSPPLVSIDVVVADRRYVHEQEISISSNVGRITFEFHGTSFKTRQNGLVYRYRLRDYDRDWQTTRAMRVEYENLPRGTYTFEVQAVDRDLKYSEPATVKVTIHPPYGQLALSGGLILALVGMATASGYAFRKRRAQRQAERAFLREQQARLQAQEQLNQELEKELQTAHELQMSLMPREAPQIPGFKLAGHCIPANHVGGDLFQYFHQSGRFSIALADVTGHAMEAAIPMMVFSGILKSQMETGSPIEALFGSLNRSLHGALSTRTFVCMAMGELHLSTRTLRISNAGCPYPYHYRAATGEVVELQLDAYPLGVRPDTAYKVIEVPLEAGDRVVFCSDGIVEAANGAGEQFGFGRTEEVIRRGCAEDLSAEALLAQIIQEVKAFSGEVPQGDDQTVVVVKVEDQAAS